MPKPIPRRHRLDDRRPTPAPEPTPAQFIAPPRPGVPSVINSVEAARVVQPIGHGCGVCERFEWLMPGERHRCPGVNPLRAGLVNVFGSREWALARMRASGTVPPARITPTGPPCACGRPFKAGESHDCDGGGVKVLPHDAAVAEAQKLAARRLLGMEA
jgi:hypothetical protein